MLVRWGYVEEAAEYHLYYDSDTSGPPYDGNDVPGYPSPIIIINEHEFTLSGLDPVKTYYLAITSLDENGNESEYSEEVSRSIEVCDESDNDGDAGSGKIVG